jgi:hypothetical protein
MRGELCKQQNLLDNDIFAQLQQLAETSGSPNSVENVIFNMIIFG